MQKLTVKHNNIYDEQKEKAMRHAFFHHYTTYESLLHILSGCSLRLSRIRCVNDPLEYERIDAYAKDKIYILCLSHKTEDSIPMWRMYADGPYGMRITFPQDVVGFMLQKENFYVYEDRLHPFPYKYWKVWDNSFLDVKYDDSQKSEAPDESGLEPSNVSMIGFAKTKAWAFENETRVRFSLRYQAQEARNIGFCIDKCGNPIYNAPPWDHVYCKIPCDIFSKIEIMINPFASKPLVKALTDAIVQKGNGIQCQNITQSAIRIRLRT